jgi:translocation and assembly module TamB
MKLRCLWYTALGLVAVIALLLGLILWVLNTQTGTRAAFALVERVVGDALKIDTVEGALSGPLRLARVQYRDPAAGVDFFAREVTVDVELLDLLRGRVHVANALANGVKLNLSEPEKPPEPPKPFSLDPPINISIDQFVLVDAKVQRDGTALLAIDRANLVAEWTHAAINVTRLDVLSPDGEIHFVADIAGRSTYVGKGHGQFRWQAGQRTFAGTLNATARDPAADVKISLTSPLAAQLDLSIEQRDGYPWRFTLNVPTFDPRDKLLPDSSLRQLSATLQGAGSLSEARVSGRVGINDMPVMIDRMNVALRGEDIGIDGALHLEQGVINVDGKIRPKAEPVAATMAVRWTDLVLPAELAGQPLASAGKLDFDGSAQSYAASGALKLGPPGQLADIHLQLHGTPQRIQLEQLDVKQAAGEMSLAGLLDLQPQLSWKIDARARRFDPGAFAAAWKGDLSFAIASNGQVLESGPEGTFTLTDLKGRLRNRELSGSAHLNLLRGAVLAGTLDVRSGNGHLQIQGERGETMNAVATADIPSLADWMPDSAGTAHARITAQGKWPELKIAGTVQGNSLRLAARRADAVSLEFDVMNPKTPSGHAQLDVQQAVLDGLQFATLTARIEGNMAEHQLEVHATGDPLGTDLLVRGRIDQGWSGNVQRLILDVKDAARLQLQKPVDINYAQNAVRVSEACFADGAIRLCMQGNTQADGAFNAQYMLQSVPLALANVFAPASFPISFSGTFEGAGSLSRSDKGELAGNAQIRSASGSIARQAMAVGDPPQVLLTYAGLNVQADLKGRDANARIEARLNETGSLQGSVALSQQEAAPMTVRGDVNANLPSLQVVELFAPQLADVKGQLALRANVSGTVAEPAVRGELQVTNLATDIPAVGLKLRNGNVTVAPESLRQFALRGQISSGKGQLAFDGIASMDGTMRMQARGTDFLAADIPGARVTVNPDLNFTRSEQHMELTGKVHVPSAAIDVQKLPRSQHTQNASPDVVVIDAASQEEMQARAIPLNASISVTLGEDVALTGFGLQATVAGQLDVRETPGAPTTGAGELRVAGTYKAYGQDLTIRQGQLLYAGTPLDNPRLNIVAVRVIDDVTAGLRVLGNAQAPQVTIFSEPTMGQSNALAYLVTGKPLDQVGEGDGDMLQSAARSLGTAAGGLLAKNVGKRLGVDEVGIKESEAIGGAALTVGQYLSPRLYLSYGVGLFEPGEVITLRYKLSKSLALEALNGPSDSRAGIEYRKER